MTPYLRNFSILATVSVLANACVIKLVEDDASWEDDTSWEDNDGYDDTSSGSSVGGFGGEAGAGGHGGSTDPGNGGSGEDPYCNDGESDQTAALCDELGVATETCDGFAAPGYAACHRGFEIYEAAHAAELASCLGLIPATDACEIAPIDACVGSMYEQACADDDIDLVCDSFQVSCEEFGESIDVGRCAFELLPFSDDGLDELIICMNDDATEGDCQSRYDTCLDAVLTID